MQQDNNNDKRISMLHDQGFFLGRGEWKSAHKQLLRQACQELRADISLAQKRGSVIAYLAWKCGLPQHRVRAQMTKYHDTLLHTFEADFLAL